MVLTRWPLGESTRYPTSFINASDVQVKIDDGKFFGGKDLRLWLCDRLKEELAFGAAVRKELEDERLAVRDQLNRWVLRTKSDE